MKRIKYVLCFLILTNVFATDYIFIMGDEKITFSAYKDEHLLISKNACKINKELSKAQCDAYGKWKKLSKKDLPPMASFGGANPGTDICLQLEGTLARGVTGDTEEYFCKFSDDSMVSLGSLYYKAAFN